MICQTQNMSQIIGGPKCGTAKILNFDPILYNKLRLKIFYAMLFLDARPSETLEINFFRSLLIKILI